MKREVRLDYASLATPGASLLVRLEEAMAAARAASRSGVPDYQVIGMLREWKAANPGKSFDDFPDLRTYEVDDTFLGLRPEEQNMACELDIKPSSNAGGAAGVEGLASGLAHGTATAGLPDDLVADTVSDSNAVPSPQAVATAIGAGTIHNAGAIN